MTESSFARHLRITPRPEDIVNGAHCNTKVSTSSSKYSPACTLVTFTAEVTMGSELYAEWRNADCKLTINTSEAG